MRLDVRRSAVAGVICRVQSTSRRQIDVVLLAATKTSCNEPWMELDTARLESWLHAHSRGHLRASVRETDWLQCGNAPAQHAERQRKLLLQRALDSAVKASRRL